VPQASRAALGDGLPYLVFVQPLTAAGQSRADWARLLAASDLHVRYRAMRGDAVRCQMGWDCHGLSIEVAVEQMLEPNVTGYDLAEFSAVCQDTALEGVREGELLADQLGVWPDSSDALVTMAPQTIAAVWGVLRRLWDAERLKSGFRVVSVCPRCATPLSTAEAARRATEEEAHEVWVRLPWEGELDTYLLAWAPIPWMLGGMVALAANPQARYALVELPGGSGSPPSQLLLAEAAVARTITGDHRVVRYLSGKSLRGTRYHPPFTFVPAGEGAHRIVLDKDVPLDRGSGLLAVTPAYDALSLALAQALDLPVPTLLDDWGRYDDSVMPWRGLSPLRAEPLLVEDLEARGLLFRQRPMIRLASLCPYCETSLIPQTRHVWSVDTASGAWILSRDRAWGCPLPVWACEDCGEQVCMAGLDELAHRVGQQADQIDPHRPAIDHLTFPCEACSGTMRRVAAVVDSAFETAILPWTAAEPGPANLAVGLGDKHLGWLGDLTEMAALLRGSLAWQQAVTVPENDSAAVWDLERRPPADSVRWAAFTGTTPDLAEQDFLRPLWRLVVQHLSPSHEQGGESPPSPDARGEGRASGELLDRWLMARLHQVTHDVTEALDACVPHQATEALVALLEDLRTWYAPHRPEGESEALGQISRLLAPFVPHIAEAIHRRIGGWDAGSVHLEDWPVPDPTWADQALLDSMSLVQELAALGQSARARADIESDRQLPQALVGCYSSQAVDYAALSPFQHLLERELGVARLTFGPDAVTKVSWRVFLDPNRAVERDVDPGEVARALDSLPEDVAADLVSQIEAGLSVSLDVGDQAYTLLPDELRFEALGRPGWAVAAKAGHLVVLEVP
jgi:isoleucyl-tRNA synthetase